MIINLEHTPKAPFKVSGTVSVPNVIDSDKPSPIKVCLQTVDVDPGPKIWSGKIIVHGNAEGIGSKDFEAHPAQVLNVESIPFEYNLEFELDSKIPPNPYKYQVVIRIEDVLSQIIISGFSEVVFYKV